MLHICARYTWLFPRFQSLRRSMCTSGIAVRPHGIGPVIGTVERSKKLGGTSRLCVTDHQQDVPQCPSSESRAQVVAIDGNAHFLAWQQRSRQCTTPLCTRRQRELRPATGWLYGAAHSFSTNLLLFCMLNCCAVLTREFHQFSARNEKRRTRLARAGRPDAGDRSSA